MAFTRERILELIDLERRRSATRRVLSTAGLVLGGGLLGATLMLLMRSRTSSPAQEHLGVTPEPGGVGAPDPWPPGPVHDGYEVPLGDGHSRHG
ncbi:MAG: hypothetical protein Q8S33_00785 [Myxococcales bacterium]|nr:hypothetical protein [Myxococcales bacterium]MDP3498827.1 hypothetical protein [Myxococcales bacterium]